MERDKELKFKELAEARVNRAITKIRLIRNLANKSHYSYSNDQVKKIKQALEKEVSDTMNAFKAIKGKDEFKLN
jgi:arginine repressor